MIVVTDIKIIKTDRPQIEWICHKPLKLTWDDNPIDSETISEEQFKTELVRGQRFFNMNREEVVIGATEKVQKTLGLCFEVYRNMSNDMEKQRKKINDLTKAWTALDKNLISIRNMSFWERVKFLFAKNV